MFFQINENTKILGRFYPTANNRGLNIYNPYFQEAGINALYILFHNPDPKLLIDGMKGLGLTGAIIAGSFERDPRVATLIDELHPISQRVKKVGMLINNGGKITGIYQGAIGLDQSIRQLTDYSDKKIVIMGAGTVVKGLLALMEMNNSKPKEVEIYNRTRGNAVLLAREFPFINSVGSLEDMQNRAAGDIFLNATYIGSPWNKGNDYLFPDSFINRFNYIVDVTFVPIRPQLIEASERLGKQVSPGHRMFLYQGKYALENILRVNIDEELLSKKMLEDFATNWS